MLSWMVEHSLRNRRFVLVFALLMMAWGGMNAGRMAVDVFPDLNKPMVTVDDRSRRHGPGRCRAARHPAAGSRAEW